MPLLTCGDAKGNWTWLDRYPFFSDYTTAEIRAEYLFCKSFFYGFGEGTCLSSYSGVIGLEAVEYIECLSLELFERFLNEKEEEVDE